MASFHMLIDNPTKVAAWLTAEAANEYFFFGLWVLSASSVFCLTFKEV